jgi:hypothetical protein
MCEHDKVRAARRVESEVDRTAVYPRAQLRCWWLAIWKSKSKARSSGFLNKLCGFTVSYTPLKRHTKS